MKAVLLVLLSWTLSATPSVDDLSLEEKVGQLFVAPVCPDRGADHMADWEKLITQCHVGGALPKQADASSQIRCLNALQVQSPLPLLVVADAEWGLAMRMRGTIAFPKNMTLGAVQDLALVEQMGAEIGREARQVGIHMTLAPVVDVNNNARNPIIHMRSFGERPEEVAARAEAMIRGLHAGGLLSCTKHFPGHGDTTVDSHQALPVVAHPRERLQSIELVPFRTQTDAIMTAHLLVPALDPKWPATLSSAILTGLLREQLHFDGLIVTDAMNMRALTDHYGAAESALLAHKAGADLLLYGDHLSEEVDRLLREAIPASFQAIVAAYKSRELPIERLNASVRRILAAKAKLGLFEHRAVAADPQLQSFEALRLQERLFEAALTWVGKPGKAADARTVWVDVVEGMTEFPKIPPKSHVVVKLRCIQPRAQDYGVADPLVAKLREWAQHSDVTVCLFGTPYAVARIPEGVRVLVAYENAPVVERVAEKVLRGEAVGSGKLPVTVARG